MKKRIFSIITMVTMFFSIYTLSEAEVAYASAFDVQKVEYCDKYGNPVDELVGGTTISAKATLKKNTSDEADATLIFLAYQDGKIVRRAISRVTFAENETEYKTVSASFTLPSDVSGCKLVSYIWKDLLNLETLPNRLCLNPIMQVFFL